MPSPGDVLPPPPDLSPGSESSGILVGSESSGILVEPMSVVEVSLFEPLEPPTQANGGHKQANGRHEPRSRDEVLRAHGLWEGWGEHYDAIPLGPSKNLELPRYQHQDPQVVGFAAPLSHVAFELRNERRHPPSKDEDLFIEALKLVVALDSPLGSRGVVLNSIYNCVNSNRRDSLGWQRALLKAGCARRLLELWRWSVPPDDAGPPPELGEPPSCNDRYWVMAILGRMLGTSAESRADLLGQGVVDYIFEGLRDHDDEVRECAICSLKGLVQHPEGREVVSYDTLVECLGPSQPSGRVGAQTR